ncbi:MAG: precorrin-4 C(11)-methyltransferase [Deltaproteobacteria bacterium]|nr:precorrin-4 C(11)-methyltransferase [Deltaproteobacteria bacterium]
MTVYFIGAGPGDPKLLTLRGAELIAACPRVLYTGSLVPRQVLAMAQPGAQVEDSASMTLEQMVDWMAEAHQAGQDTARVHTGDPSLYGAVAEQTRALTARGIPWEIIPGVSSFSAASAALGRELTLPETAQTVILTRMEGRTPMPSNERLEELARHQTTMVFFLSAGLLNELSAKLIPHYGETTPAAVVYKASWPDQKIVRGTLANIAALASAAGIRSQAIVVVGRVLEDDDFAQSKLYDPAFAHKFRKATKA